MKNSYRLYSIIGIILLLSCLLICPALAENRTAENSPFPEGVVVVPQGTGVSLKENGYVTIRDCPVEIRSGDTFVVYLQDLPIAYVAGEVTEQGGRTRIAVEEADKSVYSGLNEEGSVKLTPDTYEFIPVGNGTYGSLGVEFMETLKYEDGTLSVTLKLDDYNKISLKFSDMELYHSFSLDEIKMGVAGRWTVKLNASTEGTPLGEFEIGQIRVYGIGKIALSINLDAAVEMSLSGRFDAGFCVDGSGNHLVKDFSVDADSVEAKGELSIGVKLTAGLDILVAEADVYAEVGVRTRVATKHTEHTDWDPPKTVDCLDFKFHVFLTVGAEVKYMSSSGRKKAVASADFDLLGDQGPCVVNAHYENGKLVSSCSEGMDTSSPEAHYGGMKDSFGSDLLTADRLRVVDTDVTLPWDMEVFRTLHLDGGVLDLDGHTLTIHGDLIQSAGVMKVGNGKLVIEGDYKLQKEGEGGAMGDSTGALLMDDGGLVDLKGSLIIQTSAECCVQAGTISVGGDIRQINPAAGVYAFYTSQFCEVVPTPGAAHVLSFEDIEHVWIGKLVFKTDLEAENVCIGSMDLEGHAFTVKGDLRTVGDCNLNGGTLTVNRNYYQVGGTLTMNHGKLNVKGSYYMADAPSPEDYAAGNVQNCRAYLHMEDADDEIRVGKDYVIASHGGHPYGKDVSIVIGGRYENLLSAGVMYIGGNFIQRLVESPYADSLFWPTDTFTVVFNGTGTQTIHCDSSGNGFRNVKFQNKDIRLTGKYLRGFTLNDDIRLTLDTNELNILDSMDLNGHSLGLDTVDGGLTLTAINDGAGVICAGGKLTVNGDLTLDCSFDLNRLNLTVNGDLTTSRGIINASKGKLTVRGSVYQSGYGAVGISSGEVTVGGSWYVADYDSKADLAAGNFSRTKSYLSMEEEDGTLRIGKDFLYASDEFASRGILLRCGTVFLGGNFRAVSTYYFCNSENHCFVLCGAGKQTVTFDGELGYFGTLILTRDRSNYTFSPEPCWLKLVEAFDSPDLSLPASVKAIEESAFEGVPARIVYIPDGCESIGAYAFRNSAVMIVRVPASCTIAGTGFDGCGQVYIFGKKGSPAEAYCKKHENCTFIPE